MPSSVIAGIPVVETADVTITEYHGGLSTHETQLSAVHEQIRTRTTTTSTSTTSSSGSSSSPWRCPDFDEYILVLKGEAQIEFGGSRPTVTEEEEETSPNKTNQDKTTTNPATYFFLVTQKHGVFLPKGCRVRVTFPTVGITELVAICVPAFTPLLEHAETDRDNRDTTTTAAAIPHTPPQLFSARKSDRSRTRRIPEQVAAIEVVTAPELRITEYFGNVARLATTTTTTLSAGVAHVSQPCTEAWQCPDFAEWVLVLEGTLHLEHDVDVDVELEREDDSSRNSSVDAPPPPNNGPSDERHHGKHITSSSTTNHHTQRRTTVVPAGSGIYLRPHERVRWSWTSTPCTYVAICQPAFTPHGCHREPTPGSAKEADPTTMHDLTRLHDKATAAQPSRTS